MISVVISFFLGIISLHFFSELPNLRTLVIILSFYILLSIILLIFFSTKRELLFKFLLAFILGFLWILLHTKSVIEQQIPTDLEGKPIEIRGIVHQIPEQQEEILRFELKIKNTIPKVLWPNAGIVKIRWIDPTHLVEVGDEWQFFVRLKRPHSYANPGSFDYEKHLFQNRIVAEGYIVDTLPYYKIKSSWISHPVDRIRAWFKAKIDKSLIGKNFSGIVSALVIGEKEEITSEQSEIFKNTGTVHLIVIAGLHIGFMAGFTFKIVGLIWQFLPISFIKIPKQQVAALASLIIAILYATLAGFSIPTQRALVMISALMWHILRKKQSFAVRNFFLALLVVILLDPLSTLSAGFWLSFGAVGAILYGMKGRVSTKSIWWRWGRAQWVVFLGLAPLMFAVFDMVSLISPLANAIAIPWISLLVVPCSLLGAFSLIIHERLGNFFLNMAEWLIELIWPLLQWGSQLSQAVWGYGTYTFWSLILFSVGILLLLAPRGLPGKYLGIIWILPFFFIKPLTLGKNEALVTVLDVGQGLSTVVETQNHVLIFDTGPKLNARFDTGERVILPFLKTRGKNKIDVLIISHGDNDHMGGAYSILKALKVNMLLTSEPYLFPEANTFNCYANQQWEWDGVKFLMLHPDGIFSKKRNDHSCVLQVKTATQSILLTADIEAKSEQRLIEKIRSGLKSSIMLVPHHGSRTSSTLPFIQAVKPEYAIIPVGYRNAYGHPKPDIVARYQNEEIKILDTVYDGSISFILNNEDMLSLPTCHRRQNKRYWHYNVHAAESL